MTRSRSARRKVGGYGVTAPAKHGPKDTFTRTTGTDAPSPIPGDDRDRPARRVAPRVVTKIPVLDDWEPAEDENEDPSVIPPHVDDVPASAAATTHPNTAEIVTALVATARVAASRSRGEPDDGARADARRFVVATPRKTSIAAAESHSAVAGPSEASSSRPRASAEAPRPTAAVSMSESAH